MSDLGFAPVAASLRAALAELDRSSGGAMGVRTIDINSTLAEDRGAVILGLLLRATGRTSAAGLRIIDLGCGFGSLALVFAAAGAQVIGIDVKRERLRIGRDVAAAHGLDAGFRRAHMEDLPFPDESFDAAVMNNSIPYVVDGRSRRDVLVETRRVLRPTGVLVSRSANRWHPRDQFSRLPLIHLLPVGAADRVAAGLGRPRSHVRLQSAGGAARELRRAGFVSVQSVPAATAARWPLSVLSRYHHVIAHRPEAGGDHSAGPRATG